jgi:hypothetical protein
MQSPQRPQNITNEQNLKNIQHIDKFHTQQSPEKSKTNSNLSQQDSPQKRKPS